MNSSAPPSYATASSTCAIAASKSLDERQRVPSVGGTLCHEHFSFYHPTSRLLLGCCRRLRGGILAERIGQPAHVVRRRELVITQDTLRRNIRAVDGPHLGIISRNLYALKRGADECAFAAGIRKNLGIQLPIRGSRRRAAYRACRRRRFATDLELARH